MKPQTQQISKNIITTLVANGLSEEKARMLLAQMLVETSGFSSRVAIQANNFGGIKFAPKFNKDSGIKSPEGDNYARYDSIDGFIKDYLRIVSRGGNNAPIKADTIAEYNRRLKAQRYYTAPETDYLKALKSWLPSIKKFIPSPQAQAPLALILIIIVMGFIVLTSN